MDNKAVIVFYRIRDVWFGNGAADPVAFLCLFMGRLTDILKQVWNAHLLESLRARF